METRISLTLFCPKRPIKTPARLSKGAEKTQHFLVLQVEMFSPTGHIYLLPTDVTRHQRRSRPATINGIRFQIFILTQRENPCHTDNRVELINDIFAACFTLN